MRAKKTILLGLGAGLLLLALVLAPLFYRQLAARHLLRVHRARLVDAGGNGRAAIAMHPLIIQPQPGETLPAGTTVSLNGRAWYPLAATGVVPDEDAAIWPVVHVAHGNRMATVPIDDQARQTQRIAVGLARAPKVAELAFFEGLKPGDQPTLPVRRASSVTLIPALPGLSCQLSDDKVIFSLPQDLMNGRFFCSRVLVKNDHGQALGMVAVLPAHADEPIPIRTADELQAIKNKPHGLYRLMNDVDLSALAWQPIGTRAQPFSGQFDGAGYAITGLHWPPKDRRMWQADEPDNLSLLGFAKHAVIRNVRLVEPHIDARGGGDSHLPSAALLTEAAQCLVENCQVRGGQIINGPNRSAGVVLEAHDSVLIHLFNSCDVTAYLPANVMCDSGGIVGVMSGHMAYCANEGAVNASHLTGGLFGWGTQVGLSHCINVGEVNGFPFIGKYPPGALFQTMDGDYAANCLYVKDNALCAGNAYLKSGISNIRALAPTDLQDQDALRALGDFEGEDAQWLLDDRVAKGPIPSGVLTLKLYRPGGELDD